MRRRDNQPAEDESPTEQSSTVGEVLRIAREALDQTVEQVAGELRIEAPYLVALENDNFDEFSAPVFAKGYLKQYALRLGLDDDELLTLYYRQVGTQQVPKLRVQTLETGEDQQQARWLIAGSALALVIAAVVIWQLSTPEEGLPVVTTVADPIEDDPVAPLPEPEPPMPVVTPAPELEPVEEAVAETIEEPAEAVIPELRVEIVFREDCWTEVIDVRGERLFYGLGGAGARSRFSATPPLSFFLGNASGVDLSVDDTPYEIPAENLQGNLARFVILESGN
ncbi:MAG: helix-turn-helix domain-containing protein [Candidatus Rariloculaceae bacterium]